MSGNRFLSYRDLDPDLAVFGYAKDGKVVVDGFGRAFEDSSAGEVVYYHPDLGWVEAATGRPVGS
jgi:hypothetical protein